MPLWADVGAVGILLVVHAAITKIMDAENKNPFVIVTSGPKVFFLSQGVLGLVWCFRGVKVSDDRARPHFASRGLLRRA